MFDLGMSELLVIGMVALVVIGPKDLPELFRSLGKFTAKLRAMGREFSRAMEAAADEAGVKDVAKDLKAVTSPRSLGLDAVKDAADKFQKWDPVKNAATPTKPVQSGTIRGPVLPEGSIPPTPAAAPAAEAMRFVRAVRTLRNVRLFGVVQTAPTGDDAKLFDDIASVNKGRQLAIIVDGEIISAPTLRTDHFGGTAVISGNFNQQSAFQLATLLENPLENPMQILSESAVSSAYGESSINQGKWVGIGGLIMTTVFMLFIYRLAGLIAIVGLVINLAIVFGGMSLFQFTLTMPGIAGIVHRAR